MTYSVSSGTLNSTVSYHIDAVGVWCVVRRDCTQWSSCVSWPFVIPSTMWFTCSSYQQSVYSTPATVSCASLYLFSGHD